MMADTLGTTKQERHVDLTASRLQRGESLLQKQKVNTSPSSSIECEDFANAQHSLPTVDPGVEAAGASNQLLKLNAMELIRCLLRADDASIRVDAVLFDKDGTLLDFIHMWGWWADELLRRFREALEAEGLTWAEPDIAGILGTIHNEEGRIVDYDVNGPLAMGTMNDVYAVLAWQGYRAGWSWGKSSRIVRELAAHVDEVLEQVRPVKAIAGVEAFIEQCRHAGLKLGVVTADETVNAKKHVEWMGLSSLMDIIIGSDQVDRGKPFPDMVQLACDQLGVLPEHTVVIGDTNGDMMMAQAADCKLAIGIGQPHIFPEVTAVIMSFTELLTEKGEL